MLTVCNYCLSALFSYIIIYTASPRFFVYSDAVVCYEFAFAAAAVVLVEGNGWFGVFYSLH